MAEKKHNLAINIAASDKVSAPLKKIGQQFEKLSSPIRRVNAQIKSFSHGVGFPKFQARLGDVSRSFKGFTSELKRSTLMVGAGAAAAFGGTLALVKNVAKVGDTLAKQASRTGFGVEALQEWQYVAERSGLAAGDLDKSIVAFSKAMGAARAGGGPLLGLLRKVDPALMRQALAAKSNEEAFSLMADALGKLKNPQAQMALAAAAFGNSGIGMVNVAKEGADGIKRLREEKQALGVLTAVEAKNAEAFSDSWLNLTQVFSGLKNTVGAALLPVFTQLADELTGFLKDNKEDIVAFAKQFAEALPKAIKDTREAFKAFYTDTWPKIKEAFAGIRAVVEPIFERFGAVNVIGGILAALIGGKLVIAVAALSKAFMLLALNPVGAFVMAFAAGAFLIMKNWEPIKEFFAELWEAISKAFDIAKKLFKYTPLGATINLLSKMLDSGSSPETSSEESDSGRASRKQKQQQDLGGLNSFFTRDENRKTSSAPLLGARDVLRTERETRLTRDAAVKVSFENLPRGARVEKERSSAPLDLSMGYAMVSP